MVGPILHKFQRDIKVVFWFAAGVFVGLSLISFSPKDPSFNSFGTIGKVSNYCGVLGSFLSDFLFQCFGVTAWALVFVSFRISYKYLRGDGTPINKPRAIWGAALLVVMSALGALYFDQRSFFYNKFLVGGVLGQLTYKGLEKILNSAGVAIFLWSLAVILFVFFTEKPISYYVKIRRFPRFNLRFLFAAALDLGHRLITSAANFLPRTQEPIQQMAGANFERQSIIEEPKLLFDVLRRPSVTVLPTNRKIELKTKVIRKVENWMLPDIQLLDDPPESRIKISERELKDKGMLLLEKLKQFGVHGTIVDIRPGPTVTMFEFKPNADVKISRIIDLADDISLALSSESVRIIAPIPGRDVVGIETSNSLREKVFFKEIVASEEFWNQELMLPIILGKQANGETKVVELRKMPHLLVAGTTGSGKSVFLVSALTGLICKHSPKTLRFIFIDPKQVDLAAFSQIPHLLMPPIVTPKKAVTALRWAIKEMEKRYRTMSKFGARGLEGYNEIMAKLSGEEIKKHDEQNQKLRQDPSTAGADYYFTPQPYIVIVVEEFGDLMAVDKANVEHTVIRLAQMARACGIHLILAMQSPRKDVITGLIKTNIPGRISFKVASKMDSRIILDESGAERLLAQGDMLFLAPGVAKPERNHGTLVTEKDIESIVKFWIKQGEPEFDVGAMRILEGSGSEYGDPSLEYGDELSSDGDESDERYDEILAYVSAMKEVSASLLQRKFRLGYPRAARIIEMLEEQGVIGPANGSKPRQVLIESYNQQ
ncbi:MAG: DNA translocase FtsK 4TM domain-containing protein [Pseudomonadota bacterium]|nr:DNA translocase FtsK 4TM domain-containing protein [Pseudomonadota bacterium]